jgi:hypothetical protein
MVAAERKRFGRPAASGSVAAAKRRGQLLAVALLAVSCVAALSAAQLRERARSAAALEQRTSKLDIAGEDDSYDGISSGLMGSLEKAMDASIDNKVSAFLSASALGSLPVPEMGPVVVKGGRGAFVPDAYKTEYADKMRTNAYLGKLAAQKRQLEREKAKLMADLRARRTATAMEAARQSITYHTEHLARAEEIAKFRLAQQAQQAARAMAKKMREATIAKQTYIHAQAVADRRIMDLDAMVANTDHYGGFVVKLKQIGNHRAREALSSARAVKFGAATAAAPAAAPAEHAATDRPAPAAVRVAKEGASVAKDYAKKGTKLYHYLQQEKELEAKIKAAERAAKKHMLAADKAAAKPQHTSAVQSAFIHSIAQALYNNKQAIKKDEEAAAHLKEKQQALVASMKALNHSDELLFKQVKRDDSQI